MLVVITMLVAGSTDGGASSAFDKIEFGGLKLCQEAAVMMREKGHVYSGGMYRTGIYVIKAKCIKVQ